jgi:hypothetical protein
MSDQRTKRWFTSTKMDIFVWLDSSRNIDKFQCSYDKETIEKAIIWTSESGFSYHGVDPGERPGNYPESPIFTTDINFDPIAVCALLAQEVNPSGPKVLLNIVKMIKKHYLY